MKKSVVWIESRWFHKTDISASPLSVSCHTRSVFDSTWPYFAREHNRPDISHQIFPLFSVLTVEVNFLLTVEVSPVGNLRCQLYIRNLRWRRGFSAKFAGLPCLKDIVFKTTLHPRTSTETRTCDKIFRTHVSKTLSSKYQVECYICNHMNFWNLRWKLYIRGLRDTMIRSKICQCVRLKTKESAL